MFDTRRFASQIHTSFAALLLVTSSVEFAAAQVPAPAGDQWRAFGVRPTAGSTASTATDATPNWQLPNQRPAAGAPQAAAQASNPLRPANQSQPIVTAREPRAFQAPARAARIEAVQPAANASPIAAVQQQSGSAAGSTAPASASNDRYSSDAGWQSPTSRPTVANRPAPTRRPAHQQRSQSTSVGRTKPQSGTSGLWQTINVAFESDEASTGKVESLPMPGPGGRMRSMAMPTPDALEYNEPFADGPFEPYGSSGGCGNGCACGDSCSCGEACEPGCGCGCGDACEPGCGCDDECSGKDGCACPVCCNDDLFCIGPGDDESCHTVRLRWPKWQEVMVFGGVQGFKGPYDQDRDSGNFGFHEGFNIGAKVPYALAGYQFGYRSTQNQLNGDKDTDIDDQHFQQFATAGVFRRTTDGIQGGVVWDLMNDERFHSLGYHQLRSELSVISGGTHEVGFTTTTALNDREVDDDVFWEATDQYLLFYRFHGPKGGEGRFYAGGAKDSNGIVGSDLLLPLGDKFSLLAGFTYLIPNEPNGEDGAEEEAWNIGLGLVWHYHNQARKCHENCYRPLFNVADNGYLIVRETDDD